MGYNCSDFVQDCRINADAYDVPAIDPKILDGLELMEDDDELSEDDELRVLAERTANAFSLLKDTRAKTEVLERIAKAARAALRRSECLTDDTFEGDEGRDLSDALAELRAALRLLPEEGT